MMLGPAMLVSAGSDFEHVVHINVFLKDMGDFDAMNAAYAGRMGDSSPARTTIRKPFRRDSAATV